MYWKNDEFCAVKLKLVDIYFLSIIFLPSILLSVNINVNDIIEKSMLEIDTKNLQIIRGEFFSEFMIR